MDHNRLGSELLRVLRGSRSQVAVSRRLGYSANVAYVWESGRRAPPAHVLFRLASLNRLPLDGLAHFGACVRGSGERRDRWQPSDTAELVRALHQGTPAARVARVIGVDRTTVARWLRGATEPRVPELLRLVDLHCRRLVEFVALFADAEALRSLRSVARTLQAQRRTAYDIPWSHAVLRVLELDAYRALPGHAPGFIAHAVGIAPSQEEELLGVLKAAGLIRQRRGKWEPVRVLTVDTRADPEADLRLKAHWAAIGLDRLRHAKPNREALFSYNLCAVSHSDFSKIRALHLEYYERARRIVAESKSADRVVLLNLQLIPLDE